MNKFITVCLINEIFDLKNTDEIVLGNNMYLHLASDIELDALKSHVELIQNSLNYSWTNYFENELIQSGDFLNPSIENLKKNKWRYTILSHEKHQLTIQELISLKLSDLNINILIQKGFEIGPTNEIIDHGEIVVTLNLFASFNLLIDTQYKFSRYGSKKYLRKKPTKFSIQNFNDTLLQVNELCAKGNQYLGIFKALNDYVELDNISNESTFKLVSYFSIIESLVTHNPRSEYGNPISKQLSNKIEFLYNNFFSEFDFSNYFKGPDTDTISTIIYKLYTYRSDVAHGNIPKFNKDLKIIAENIQNVLPFMETLLRQILKISVSKPSLIVDLKKC
uniref:hypothetical protein n=1 Tax=Flavobacterium sp. TaxID=239 RepID=UPI00404B87D5